MDVRNRMNFGREQSSAQFQGYGYGNSPPQQLGPPRENGLGGRDSSAGRRSLVPESESQLSRRLSGPFPGVDGRGFSARGGSVQGVVDGRIVPGGRGGVPLPGSEPTNLNSQQMLNAGVVNRTPYEQGGLLGPGGVGSHLHSIPMRGGVNNYGNMDGYGSLQQQQVQLTDGSLRTMYSVPELGGSLPGELGGHGLGGFRGGYVGSEDAKLALAAVQGQQLQLHQLQQLQHQQLQQHQLQQQQQGVFQGRQIVRDGRLVNVGGWEEEPPIVPPLSPRAMPMSPRRDDLVRMPMSPRRDDISPPMSPRRDDMPYMMSPRRDDISPPRSPRRREYPTPLEYGVRLPHRRGLSPTRDEDFLRGDYPMSPRRDLTPPMSPRGGWDYERPPISPPRLSGPMSPRHGTPTRSPVWNRSRHSTKPPSQWDVLPGKGNAWNSGSERENRRDSRRADHGRSPERSYGADLDEPRRGWGSTRKGDRSPPRVRSYGDQPSSRFGMGNRPLAYNSVVNQRVGLVTKYIERERAEKAKERATKEAADRDGRDSRRKPDDRDNRDSRDRREHREHREHRESRDKRDNRESRDHRDSNKPSHSERRNEKDTLAAAIAKTTANIARKASQSGKHSSRDEKSGKAVPASGTTHSEKTGGGDKTSGSKPPTANTANGNVAAQAGAGGSSVQPSNSPGVKDGKNTEDAKVSAEDNQKNNAAGSNGKNNASQNNGPSSKPANGVSNVGTKQGEDQPREPTSKRPSLVMEIERAKKSRKQSENQKHTTNREVEETYYDANELSADFVSKVNKAGTRYSRVINDDQILKKKLQGGAGGQGGLQCLVCGKGSKTFSDANELVKHAQHSQVQNKRIDHMGFRKALIDVLKLDIVDPPVSNIESEEDMVVWPPVVVVENTRTALGTDNRWEGVTNTEMALILNELGHLHGRPKSIWDKFGHRGIVHVEFDPTLDGLQEAERLHNYFLQNGRGRVQWDIIRPFKTGLPGFESVPEGPDFTRLDEATQTTRRVLYGYVALKKDVDKIFSKKQRKKVQVVNRKEVKAKLVARQSGETVVI